MFDHPVWALAGFVLLVVAVMAAAVYNDRKHPCVRREVVKTMCLSGCAEYILVGKVLVCAMYTHVPCEEEMCVERKP